MNRFENAIEGKVFDVLKRAAKETGKRAFVIGGFVRDYFLGIPNDDIDVVIEGSGIEFARYIAENLIEDGKVQYYENYGTAMVKIFDCEVEFVGARKEMYERGSRKPIVEEGTLKDDQLRRDFTINAMAFSLNEDNLGELIDPFNGIEDLKNGKIRTPQDPNITFSDDPLRMFRAVRFISKLSTDDKLFTIEENTYNAIFNNLYRTVILSKERIMGEIDKMLGYKTPSYGFKMMKSLGLSNFILEDNVEFISGSFANTIDDITAPNEWKWAYLFASSYFYIMRPLGINYNLKNLIVNELKMPISIFNLTSKFIEACEIIYNSMTLLSKYSDFKKLRRIPYIFGEDWETFIDVYDKSSFKWHNSPFNKEMICSTIKKYEKEFIDWKCPLDGNDIMEILDIPEGKKLGNIKKELENGILDGDIPNTINGAKEFLNYKKSVKV